MVKTLVTIAIIAACAWLVLTQPWKPKRYDSTPAGKEAKKIDEHVQEAFDWHPPGKFEAKTFLGSTPSKKVYYEAVTGGMSFDEAHKFYDACYAAGSPEVDYLNVKQSVREGSSPEGLVIVLPSDPAKRKAVFTTAAAGFKTAGKPVPPDVKQKYLYIPISGTWTPDKPDPSFMPSND